MVLARHWRGFGVGLVLDMGSYPKWLLLSEIDAGREVGLMIMMQSGKRTSRDFTRSKMQTATLVAQVWWQVPGWQVQKPATRWQVFAKVGEGEHTLFVAGLVAGFPALNILKIEILTNWKFETLNKIKLYLYFLKK